MYFPCDPTVNKIYLVMDYLKRGDLMKALNNGSLNDIEVWNVTKQVMVSLKHNLVIVLNSLMFSLLI